MDLIRDIGNYLDDLRGRWGLYVSLHPMEWEPVIGTTDLMRFNLHAHPLCVFLKTDPQLRAHCVACQKKVLSGVQAGLVCGTCHAGVSEYLYPIRSGGRVIGFISVSGYRPAEWESYACRIADLYGFDKTALCARYRDLLRQDMPPREEIDRRLHPLIHMLTLAYLTAPAGGDAGGDLYGRILHWIHLHYTSPITLAELSETFRFSRSYISRLFTRRCGMNLNRYIHRCRIACAKQLLSGTDLPVTEIAYSVGYSDSNYFSYVFRCQEQITPTQYRRRNP